MNEAGLHQGRQKRAYPRYKVSFRVTLMREESSEAEGAVTDLGAGGCFVETVVPVCEDDLVKLHIEVPGHDELIIWGNVVYWINDTGFGVRFSAFSQGGARDRLAAILAEESHRA